jgi:hypothetical protein
VAHRPIFQAATSRTASSAVKRSFLTPQYPSMIQGEAEADDRCIGIVLCGRSGHAPILSAFGCLGQGAHPRRQYTLFSTSRWAQRLRSSQHAPHLALHCSRSKTAPALAVAKGDNGIGTGVGLRRAPPVAHTVVPCLDSSRGGSRAERGGHQRKEGLATGDALGSTAGESIKGLLAHGVLLGETKHHNHTRRRLWV